MTLQSTLQKFIFELGALTMGICKWRDGGGRDCEGKYRIICIKKNKIIRAKGRSALVPFCSRSCGASPRFSPSGQSHFPLQPLRMLARDLQMNLSLRIDLGQRQKFMFPVRQPTSNDQSRPEHLTALENKLVAGQGGDAIAQYGSERHKLLGVR